MALQALPADKKKTTIYIVVIAVCLVGAAVGYMLISDSGSGAAVPTATEQKQDEITKKMNEANPPQPEAPMPTARRGAVQGK